jgi:DNA modification methylase
MSIILEAKDIPPDLLEYFEPIINGKRDVFTVTTKPFKGAHFATFPPDLILPCILAGCPVGGTVLDPFAGSGTTGMVALELGRKAILIELNPAYAEMCRQRTNVTHGLAL